MKMMVVPIVTGVSGKTWERDERTGGQMKNCNHIDHDTVKSIINWTTVRLDFEKKKKRFFLNIFRFFKL